MVENEKSPAQLATQTSAPSPYQPMYEVLAEVVQQGDPQLLKEYKRLSIEQLTAMGVNSIYSELFTREIIRSSSLGPNEVIDEEVEGFSSQFTDEGLVIDWDHLSKDKYHPKSRTIPNHSRFIYPFTPSYDMEEMTVDNVYLEYNNVKEIEPEAYYRLLGGLLRHLRQPNLTPQESDVLRATITEIVHITNALETSPYNFIQTNHIPQLRRVFTDEEKEYLKNKNVFRHFLSNFLAESDYLDRLVRDPGNIAALKANLMDIYENEKFVDNILSSFGLGEVAEGVTPEEENIKKIQRLRTQSETLDTIVKDWIDNPEYPGSRNFINEIHKQVVIEEDYGAKGITPQPPGEYRKTDLQLSTKPTGNFYVRAGDIPHAMQRFTKELDTVLINQKAITFRDKDIEWRISRTISEAAWAYYSFIRIHPFLDGNGRTGRYILQRILRGAGLRQIDFNESYYNDFRLSHIGAMESTDQQGALWPLQIYILMQLRRQYNGQKGVPNPTLRAIEKVLLDQAKDIVIDHWRSTEEEVSGSLEMIWDGFSGLDIEGTSETGAEMMVYVNQLVTDIEKQVVLPQDNSKKSKKSK